MSGIKTKLFTFFSISRLQAKSAIQLKLLREFIFADVAAVNVKINEDLLQGGSMSWLSPSCMKTGSWTGCGFFFMLTSESINYRLTIAYFIWLPPSQQRVKSKHIGKTGTVMQSRSKVPQMLTWSWNFRTSSSFWPFRKESFQSRTPQGSTTKRAKVRQLIANLFQDLGFSRKPRSFDRSPTFTLSF